MIAHAPALPSGILPMQYAFFRPDGGLDLDAFRLQVEACLRAGVHGIAILGLATEVAKLAAGERSALLHSAAAACAGRAQVSVTVFGQTPEAQIAFVREAERAGAASVILQPPRIAGIAEADLARFFGRVIDAAGIPAAAQERAEALYREVLPLLTRAVHDRAPAQVPSAFGLECLERHAARLGTERLAGATGR
ncbi:MAG: dihydrodipicolinate synthase family protein [Betaproteobacteria bacterium]